MLRLGLLGKNIQGSRSKEMYEKLLSEEVDYTLFDHVSFDDIPSLNNLFNNIQGLSITAPYKKHFLDSVRMKEDVRKLNAINCIKKVGDEFHATNTDFLACVEILKPFFENDLVFYILGDGSMSKVLQILLESYSQTFEVRSRRLGNLINNPFVNLAHKKSYLIINTCHRNYLFDELVDAGLEIYWDLNYSVSPPPFFVGENSKKYVDGMDLLFLQAKYALKFWGIN